jgi:threonine synthase
VARTVVISTANGLKFTEFKLGYHERSLAGVPARLANAPIVMEPDVEKVAGLLDAMG